jgi:glycosyltransferase involved in cell wall biosynthesis
LGPRVQDAGFVPTDVLASYMAAADAFVVPLSQNLSSRARWPSRINVALAHGLPVVVTRVGDLPLLLEHEDAAFVARPDAEDIVRKLAEVVGDRAAVERVRTSARRVAAELLAWPLVVDQLEEFYSAVFARGESPVAAARQSPENFGIR